MRKLLTILSLLVTSTVFGQGFTYSYVDPCSKKLKTIYLNSNESVTVNYLGVIGTFNQADFQNGIFSSWVQLAQSQAASQPCDELKAQTQTNQNLFITQNIISTLTSITAASTMNVASGNMMSSTLGNSTSNASENNSSSPGGKKNSNRNGNQQTSPGNQTSNASNPTGGQGSATGGTNTNSENQNTGAGGQNQLQGGSGTSTNSAPQAGSRAAQPPVNDPGSGNTSTSGNSPGNSTTSSSGNQGGNSSNGENSGAGSNQNTVSGQGSSSNSSGTSSPGSSQGRTQGQTVSEESTPPKSSSDQGQSGNGGTTNSVSNAAEASSSPSSSGGGSKVRVGSLVGTGDVVAIRSAEDNSNQFRGTMSVTKSNTNNTRAKGFLLNFTSTINNSNLTLYSAFTNKKKTNTLIVANSSMIDFNANFFNTTTALESKRFGRLTVMAGANFTLGKMAGEPFNNLSGVGGGFYPFKMGKKISGNTLLLAVYSPYTKFYEGKWWDSGILLVPFSSWDYTISKSFKYNLSFSGTYQVNGSVLQYQILTGGKILL